MKSVARQVLQFPLTRIVVGTAVCGIAMLATNGVLRLGLGSEGDAARIFRWLMSIAALLGAYHVLFRSYEGRAITELSGRKLPGEGLLGLLGGASCGALVILVLYLAGCYEVLSAGRVAVLPLILVFCLATAAFEEVIFRGILYRIVEGTVGTMLALILSALLFGLAHLWNENADAVSVVSAAAGGVLVGLMFSLTRRLWLPIAFHAGWNWALAALGTVVSGNENLPTFLRVRLRGPVLITGGAFGPENSIITVGLVLLLCGVGYYRLRKRGGLVAAPWVSRRAVGE